MLIFEPIDMRLIINEYGTVLKREGNRFIIFNKSKGLNEEYSADNVNQIIISSGSSISSNVIKLAMENYIDIVYINKFGRPYARIYPCTLGGTTLTRKKQAEAYLSKKSLLLAKAFVEGKIRNQCSIIKSLAKSRASKEMDSIADDILNASLESLDSIEGGTIEDFREVLLGIEGSAAARYFLVLSSILPMKGRDRESKDSVNIMLNYAYGILYSEIEKACIIAGLDPYLGYFHTDRYGKPCMVLDLIEEFRAPVVDRAVITLFVRKMVDEEKDFIVNGETKVLSDSGKNKVIEAVMRRLHTNVKFGKKKMSLNSVILEQARAVTRLLLDQESSYKPYIHRW